MKTFHLTLLALALLAATATVGCSNQDTAPGTSTSTTGVGEGPGDGIGDSIERSIEEGRRKMATENITVGHEGSRKAEITPAGDLLIDGKAVTINAEQRALLLAHREQVTDIASAGMDVGLQGAKLATRAMTEAVTGIFSGNPDRIEKRVEAQAQGIRAAARELCDRLPAMFASQQALAKAVPEYAPFAKMEPEENVDCKKNVDNGSAPTAPPSTPPAPSAPRSTPAGTSGSAGTLA